MNAHEAHRAVEANAAALADAEAEHRAQVTAAADAERTYRKAKARAWAQLADSGLLAKAREAQVDADTADDRYARDLAEGLRQSALEAIRSRRTEITAVQSLMGAFREEAALARTGPEMTP